MTATRSTVSTLLVAIDISKHRHEVLIGVPGKKPRRRWSLGPMAQPPATLPDRHAPIDAHPGDDLAQTARLQSFRRMTS